MKAYMCTHTVYVFIYRNRNISDVSRGIYIYISPDMYGAAAVREDMYSFHHQTHLHTEMRQ